MSTADGKKFRTTADSGPVTGNSQSGPVPISASAPGAAGNVAAGAIVTISNNPEPNRFHVVNQGPSAGGVDPVNQKVVSQQDLDNAKKQLGDPLQQKVKDDIAQKATGHKLLADTEDLNVTETADHKVNDVADNFNATVSVDGKAIAVDDAKVKEALKAALKKQVPTDYGLTDDPLKLDYTVAQHDSGKGSVALSGTASGFMATAIDESSLQKALTGKSVAQGRAYIMGRIDASDVIIRETPPFIPWLPLVSGRIDIRRQVENSHPQ